MSQNTNSLNPDVETHTPTTLTTNTRSDVDWMDGLNLRGNINNWQVREILITNAVNGVVMESKGQIKMTRDVDVDVALTHLSGTPLTYVDQYDDGRQVIEVHTRKEEIRIEIDKREFVFEFVDDTPDIPVGYGI